MARPPHGNLLSWNLCSGAGPFQADATLTADVVQAPKQGQGLRERTVCTHLPKLGIQRERQP